MKSIFYFLLAIIFLSVIGVISAPATKAGQKDSILQFIPSILSASHQSAHPTVPPSPRPSPTGVPYIWSSTISGSSDVPGATITVQGQHLAYHPHLTIYTSEHITLHSVISDDTITFQLPTASELEQAGVISFSGTYPTTVYIDYGVDANGDHRYFTLPVTITNIPKPIPQFIMSHVPIGGVGGWDEGEQLVAAGKRVRVDVWGLNATDASNLQDIRIRIGDDPLSPVAIVKPVTQGSYNKFWYDPVAKKDRDHYGYLEFVVPASVSGVHGLWVGRLSRGNQGWNTGSGAYEYHSINVYTLGKPIYQGLWPAGATRARRTYSWGNYYVRVQFRLRGVPPEAVCSGHLQVGGTVAGKQFAQYVDRLNDRTFSFTTRVSATVPPNKISFTISYNDFLGNTHTSDLIEVNLKKLSDQRISEVPLTNVAAPYTVATGVDVTFDSKVKIGNPGDNVYESFLIWIDGVIASGDAIRIQGAKEAFLKLPAGRYTVHKHAVSTGIDTVMYLNVTPILSGIQYTDFVNAAQGGTFSVGGLKVTIPANALSGDTQITLRQSTSNLLDENDPLSDDGHGFNITFSDADVTSSKPIEVEIPFQNSQGTDVSELFGAFYDQSVGMYDYLETTIEDGLAKITIPAVPQFYHSWPSLFHNPPTYQDAVDAVEKRFPSINSLVQSLAVIRVKSTPTSIDTTRKIKVISPSDPSTSGYVPPAVVGQILNVAADAYDFYQDELHFPKPNGWIKIHTEDLGPVDALHGTAGKTSAGIFGQPYITINSRMRDDFLKTSVIHEFGHGMQRQINTNLRGTWLDEGVANWGAWKVYGITDDLITTMETGGAFPEKKFPTSWWIHINSIDQEDIYASMFFFAWLEKEYGKAKIKTLFDKMVLSPLNWASPERVLTQATGSNMVSIVKRFAGDYWMQTYSPVDKIQVPLSTRDFSTHSGGYFNNLHDNRPARSSKAYEVSVVSNQQTRDELYGRDVVVRLMTPGSYVVSIWKYAHKLSKGVPLSPQSVGVELHDKATAYIGKLGVSSNWYYRIVVTNYSTHDVDAHVLIALPTINTDNTGRKTGSRNGGYTLSYSSGGLGSEQGTISVGGIQVTPTFWNDTAVTFTMPEVPDSWGQATITAITAEGAKSNSINFSFTD